MMSLFILFSFEIHLHKLRPHIGHQSPGGQQCGRLRFPAVHMETGEVQLTVRQGGEPRGATGAAPGYDGDQAGRQTLSGAVVWVCYM